LAVAQSDVRALALRSDDFREVCEDDAELGEVLLEALAAEIAARLPARRKLVVTGDGEGAGATDPNLESAPTLPPRDVPRAKTPSAKSVSDFESGPTLPPGTPIPSIVRPISDLESAPTLPPRDVKREASGPHAKAN